MSTTSQHNSSPPTQEEAISAESAFKSINRHFRRGDSLKLSLANAHCKDCIVLPAEAAELLLGMLNLMAKGHGVALTAIRSELTTSQAAEILHVSRPYLVKLLEAGDIPYHKVGKHRRVRREDVMNYKNAIDRRREAILDEMVAESQELGLYD